MPAMAAHHLAPRGADARHFAALDDVDATAVGAARIAPGHRIVAHCAAAPLQEAALDGKARIVIVEEGIHLAHRIAVEQLGIHAVDAHGVAAPREGVALRIGVTEVQDAALRDHGVEVEVLLEAFPQLHRPFVEGVVARQQVVGANDGGVAADVARTQPALLQHGHIGEAMLLGEVIGGGQAMPAAAHDDDVVFRLGIGLAPGRRPVLVAGRGVLQEREDGVFHATTNFRPIEPILDQFAAGKACLRPGGRILLTGRPVRLSNQAWCRAPTGSGGGSTGSIHCA
jgi:hypothetical protein